MTPDEAREYLVEEVRCMEQPEAQGTQELAEAIRTVLAELERLKSERQHLIGEVFQRARERDQLKAEVERLRSSLASYQAAAHNYVNEHNEVERLREALGQAVNSLETIAEAAGSRDDADGLLRDMSQVRGYARSRASVARAALRGESPLRVEDLLDGLPRLSTPEEAVKVMGDGQPLVKMREIR